MIPWKTSTMLWEDYKHIQKMQLCCRISIYLNHLKLRTNIWLFHPEALEVETEFELDINPAEFDHISPISRNFPPYKGWKQNPQKRSASFYWSLRSCWQLESLDFLVAAASTSCAGSTQHALKAQSWQRKRWSHGQYPIPLAQSLCYLPCQCDNVVNIDKSLR